MAPARPAGRLRQLQVGPQWPHTSLTAQMTEWTRMHRPRTAARSSRGAGSRRQGRAGSRARCPRARPPRPGAGPAARRAARSPARHRSCRTPRAPCHPTGPCHHQGCLAATRSGRSRAVRPPSTWRSCRASWSRCRRCWATTWGSSARWRRAWRTRPAWRPRTSWPSCARSTTSGAASSRTSCRRRRTSCASWSACRRPTGAGRRHTGLPWPSWRACTPCRPAFRTWAARPVARSWRARPHRRAARSRLWASCSAGDGLHAGRHECVTCLAWRSAWQRWSARGIFCVGITSGRHAGGDMELVTMTGRLC
mmetsp:Transcript_23177/g.59197  ORF Transcript_23177/g.59197 Transcript_23177/m.59197 type:complete len:309 (-) Transcript_23177:144-1070(-)